MKLKSLTLLLLLLLPKVAMSQGEPVKPYLLFIMDTSGSMTWAVNDNSLNSCNNTNVRLDHAKCAFQRITNGFGELILGLGKFRQSSCNGGVSPCNTANGHDGDSFDLLVPVLEENQDELLEYVDFVGANECLPDRELYGSGATPLGGALEGARRYWQGINSPSLGAYWTGAGDDPIRDDPFSGVFVGGEQCRPYITVLMTDGDETCFGDAPAAAASLLATVVDGNTYRVETIPIGFGIAPGNPDIEAIAHAGGAPNGPGNEGIYAANEDELAVALSDIIAENLKFEICNDLDDDCDALIDEDFPGKGMVCDDGDLGKCRGTGTFVCTADNSSIECQINDPGQSPTTEICNGDDDDCDGAVDEGGICTGCDPVEQCDNLDNDCDGMIDENISRPCGSDVGECASSTQTCSAGSWSNCGDTGPTDETCDGLDNDCDGIVDGFAEICTSLAGNTGLGECQSGTRVCPADGSGTWGACLGEIGPTAESCDTLDNDCDNTVDENTGGGNCDTVCGIGTTECVNGSIVCNATQTPVPETCNGADDDCDGAIDEGIPDDGPCDPSGTLCTPGVRRCVGGAFQCIGGTPPDPEVCDCDDNDCDGQIDEGSLCSAGQSCVSCQCAAPCNAGEFPCPLGQRCDAGFCIVDKCFNVNCPTAPNGDLTVCVEGQCERVCDSITCVGDFVCKGDTGFCVSNDCSNFPEQCPSNEFCVDGTCVTDDCEGVSCGSNQHCFGGDCVDSCGNITCPEGERCRMGACQPNPCGGPCRSPEVCDDQTGECSPNPCNGVRCSVGQVCNSQTGDCEQDKCLGVTCPNSDESCFQGGCYSQSQINETQFEYFAPGGGGCSGSSAPPWHLLVPLFFLAIRRQRHA